MRKIILVLFVTFLLVPAFSREAKEKSEYQEISFDEAVKRRNGGEDLDLLYCKTDCHLTLINWNSWAGWYQLGFYSGFKENCDSWSLSYYVSRHVFNESTPMFSSFTIYYHFVGSWSNGFEPIIDYIEPRSEIRFVGHSYRATDSLRVRSSPSLTAGKIGLMQKHDEATVLEVGQRERIDGVDSAWVKIRTESGLVGWAFGGFLTDGFEYR